jgi:16S rRNA G966 N2-methylase RsmD
MARCCDPRGCDDFFDPRFAGRVAKRYRERGLDRTRQRMVDFLAEQGLQGATVLEIGGGIGEIQVELLKRGASRAVNLELSPAYDAEANALLQESGLADRAERRIHDIAVDPEGIEPVDVVVLHRVVCCYPDYERLLGAAADHARRALVFSHPPRNPFSRAFVGVANLSFKLRGREFRTFAHPPKAMVEVLERRGMRRAFRFRGVPWQVAGVVRT